MGSECKCYLASKQGKKTKKEKKKKKKHGLKTEKSSRFCLLTAVMQY